MVAQTRPPSPNKAIAKLVARADPRTFTALLPIRIDPISPSRSARSFSTILARLSPLLVSWRMRASDAAVSAVSALEKKADATISKPIVSANSHMLDSIEPSLQQFCHNSLWNVIMHKSIANGASQHKMHHPIAGLFIILHVAKQNFSWCVTSR